MKFSDLANNISVVEEEERKDDEFDWIWKENLIQQPI